MQPVLHTPADTNNNTWYLLEVTHSRCLPSLPIQASREWTLASTTSDRSVRTAHMPRRVPSPRDRICEIRSHVLLLSTKGKIRTAIPQKIKRDARLTLPSAARDAAQLRQCRTLNWLARELLHMVSAGPTFFFWIFKNLTQISFQKVLHYYIKKTKKSGY